MNRQRGMTLVEVLVSLAIVAVIVGMASTMTSGVLRETQVNVNKQFATQKAMSMLEELRALLQTQSEATAVVLDDFDDGTTSQPLLTTQRSVTDPAHAASGNSIVAGDWLYTRRISVQKVRGASDLRLVNVKVFIRERGSERLLAEVAGVLSTIGQPMPPSQVYDVYLIAIENVPGWWLYMQNVVPFVERAMDDLETRHPGLVFRRHWIRKLSYGRDRLYTPTVNEANDSTSAIDSVYFYPGTMPSGSAVQTYYPPDFFNARVSVDGAIRNDFDATLNPYPYALADQYNHGMRYEDERALFDMRVASGQESEDSPTLRLLLDDMYMHPSKYRNAIVINLHGDLFPFPPVRNYSDAAKKPDTHPWVRAVTHAEKLAYGNTEPVKLRVYSYHTKPNDPGSIADWLGKGGVPTPVTVVLKGINWTPAPNAVTAIAGGVDFDGDGSPDGYAAGMADLSPQPSSAPTRMWWSYEISGGDTILKLYNSPLKSPCAGDASCDEGGLDAEGRLYDLEYIPSPLENLPDSGSPAPFTVDLTTTGTTPKNTARWVITIPSFALPSDRVLTVETQIGADLSPKVAFPVANAPSNASRTYVWRGTDTWLYGDATHEPNLPITERFQLIGDPRHLPYADVKLPHAASGLARSHRLGMGYNRYFDDFHAPGRNRRSRWPGWMYNDASGQWYGIRNNPSDNTVGNDGWDTGAGMLEVDVPRVFEILRSSLVRANAVYTTMTGFSYYYLGMGNEIGYDSANAFPNSIPISAKPFTGASGSRFEDSITSDSGGGVKYVRENGSTPNYWWAMSWLGELYPDTQWTRWATEGNLATGSGAGTFSRVLRGSISSRLPEGTALTNSVRRTQEEGSTTFFWSGAANATFHHRYQDNTDGTLATDGQAIADTYQIPIPPSISNRRPFGIAVNDTSMNPTHFLQNAYGSANTLSQMLEFYRHATGGPGSALLALRSGTDASFVVVNGLSPVGQSGIAFISRWSFLSLIQSFLSAGLYSSGGTLDPSRIHQLPRVAITSPNDSDDIENPTTLAVAWESSWRRWDGLPYTPAYPMSFSETTPVRYALLYSRNNGRDWLHMTDDTPARPGTRPAAAYLQTTASYNWSVPAAQFPKGNYLIRVEAYRDDIPLHYSFHQYRAFIKR